jgi:hypothetical protein
MEDTKPIDISELIQKNSALLDEALRVMNTQNFQIEILLNEVRAWRAFWFTPGNLERMSPVNEAVAKTNASKILRDVPGIQGSNYGV